uniref:Uncharacterized protein n=1 Tax=Picea sitchensis TaxID=3332 RepID=A9P0X7_PICSI|nr:unknown [Picea sitchensis]
MTGLYMMDLLLTRETKQTRRVIWALNMGSVHNLED